MTAEQFIDTAMNIIKNKYKIRISKKKNKVQIMNVRFDYDYITILILIFCLIKIGTHIHHFVAYKICKMTRQE